MAALTGKKPKNTYKDLLQVSNSNAGIDGTLRFVSDGEGTDSTLKLSTASISTTSKIVVGGDTAASDAAAIGYTSAEGLIITGQGSTSDITVKNDADAAVLTIATGTTNVDIVGDVTASTVNADGDTSASDNAAMGYTSAEGLILTGQGSTNDITIKNDADADVLVIPTGATNVDIVGDATAATFKPDGDTSASDTAAIGYTSAEGLILTGQGSTNDITLKNDADGEVFGVPTGTTGVTFKGVIRTDDATDSTSGTSGSIQTDGGIGAVKEIVTDATFQPLGDTAASDKAAVGYTSAEGLILTGQGSTNDVTIKNDADGDVISIPTGTTNVTIAGDLTISGDDLTMGTNTSGAALIADGTNFNPVVISGDVSIGTDGAATIANNAVSLAKMAGLARGKLIYGDSSGDPAALAVGSANNVLKSDGTDASWGTVATAGIADDAITSAKIADDAVVTAAIADDAITSALIADDAVVTAAIADDAITAALIADDAVGSAAIADDAITSALIADDAVVSAAIADSAVVTAAINDDAVTLAKMNGLARGKLIYGDSSGNPAALALGSANYVLTSDGTDAAWAAASTGAVASYTNSTDNRVITSVNSTTINGEANLTFDGSVLAVAGNVTATGTVEPAGDTSASDNAAIGYTSAEGLILTGQGSTNDVTIKNDADADVITIPTGATGVVLAGALTLGGAVAGADQTLARVNLKDYGEVTSALGSAGGARTVDLEDGNNFTATVSASTVTWTFSNPTASDELCGFTLFLTNGGSQTVNWPGSVDWAGGTAPTLTASGLDILVFVTTDGGTIWHGMVASADSK